MAQVTRRQASGPGGSVREQNRGLVSIEPNASMGFFHVGTLKEVGRKFDRLLDVHILQKML
jgi:L-amino acid N-acyltransferase YncA